MLMCTDPSLTAPDGTSHLVGPKDLGARHP